MLRVLKEDEPQPAAGCHLPLRLGNGGRIVHLLPTPVPAGVGSRSGDDRYDIRGNGYFNGDLPDPRRLPFRPVWIQVPYVGLMAAGYLGSLDDGTGQNLAHVRRRVDPVRSHQLCDGTHEQLHHQCARQLEHWAGTHFLF